MSKAEILQQLPSLSANERRAILERICELDDQELLRGGEPDPGEKMLLDRELEEYEQNRESGSAWTDVENRIRTQSK